MNKYNLIYQSAFHQNKMKVKVKVKVKVKEKVKVKVKEKVKVKVMEKVKEIKDRYYIQLHVHSLVVCTLCKEDYPWKSLNLQVSKGTITPSLFSVEVSLHVVSYRSIAGSYIFVMDIVVVYVNISVCEMTRPQFSIHFKMRKQESMTTRIMIYWNNIKRK